MKSISIIIVFSSMVLFSCGGSEGKATTEGEVPAEEELATQTSKEDFIANLSNTTWEKECFPDNILSNDDSAVLWYINIKVDINSSLESRFETKFYRPTDTLCGAVVFDTLEISTFEITDKVISEESIEAYGLNETFIYNSDNSDPSPSYTLIYVDSEKLYFGQKSDSNLGDTLETRHSSISLDDYFTQIIK